MQLKIHLTILFLMTGMTIMAKVDYKKDIYNAFITQNMSLWKTTIDGMAKVNNLSPDQKLELLNYQYGFIGWCINKGNEDEAEEYLERAEKNLASLQAMNFKPSYLHVYQSAVYGFKVTLNSLKAPVLGLKSIDEAKLAMTTDANNALGYLSYGNTLYYRPQMFGGSKTEAIGYYLQAEKLMEKQVTKGDWNYLNLLAIIGKAYFETGNKTMTKQYYTKALQAEPLFAWIKNELMPQLGDTKNSNT